MYCSFNYVMNRCIFILTKIVEGNYIEDEKMNHLLT
jgi:hypothetical protein